MQKSFKDFLSSRTTLKYAAVQPTIAKDMQKLVEENNSSAPATAKVITAARYWSRVDSTAGELQFSAIET